MKKSNFVILYGGCGRIGIRTIDLLLDKKIYVLNIDPNYKKYHNNLNEYYSGIDNSNFERSLDQIIESISNFKNLYNLLGIINFSRLKINLDKDKLSTKDDQNNKVFKVMLFDFIKIIDELVNLGLSDFSIINFSSLNATLVSHQSILYHSIKGAIESASRAMAFKLADRNIRSNVIIPALVNNEYEQISTIEKHVIPLKKGTPNPKEIAKLVFFLLSQDSSCITGSSVKIDSGMSLPDTYTSLSTYIIDN